MPSPNLSPKSLLDVLDDPALLVDRNIVVAANAAATALLGAGIKGSDVRIAIRHPQALEFILEGKTGDLELTGIGAVGRPWRLSLRLVSSTMLLLRLIDRSVAHAAEKIRVDFVANASHELRTPLTTILGYAESLEDGDVDPPLARKFVGTIRSEAKRMLRLVEDLMSLSRIEASRYVAPTGLIDMNSVVRSATDNLRPALQQRECEVEFEQQDVPEIAGDLPQLVQVVDNLLSNALRYGCEAGSKIRVSLRPHGEWVQLQVSDEGPGIPREHLPRITQRFYRVDAARSRDSGGTGLGLAIVKHIVERHRGLLNIESDEGRGTRVTVRLPVAR